MKLLPPETDFLIIGAGVAGLRAAIELAPAGRVLVLAKKELTESATQYAQGGIAAALSDEDEIGLHLQDTIAAGDGLVHEAAASVLVEEGPERIQELIAWGTGFDREGTRLTFTREGAHSRSRVLHAHGDSTGREIGRALFAKAKTLKNIAFVEFGFSSELCLEDGRVAGVRLINDEGAAREVRASAVLLATGGLGQVYRETTNPSVATGDGVAMAWRAGAAVMDMEFVQFHPTALYVKGAPRFLLSEALRGEGAYLRNMELHRFMPKYHELAELAPRDVVARAIAHELELARSPDAVVYLDLTHLDAGHIRRRFPRIFSTCMQYNVDIATDLVPVRPAAHYAMGGVQTDLEGCTTLPGLYAAGEVACTGVHGANRLASNSLLEGLVYGARAGAKMREALRAAGNTSRERLLPASPMATGAAQASDPEALIGELRDLAWRRIGIVRDGAGLEEALAQLAGMTRRLPGASVRRACEARNLHVCATLIARSALARKESRGGHYRSDYPQRDDAHFRRHSVLTGESVAFAAPA